MPRSPLRGARKIFQDRAPGDKDGNGPKAGLAFSWPILGALALFLIGAVIWAFLMGFMVGQGHNPQKKIQEITGLSLSGSEGEKAESQEEETMSPAIPLPDKDATPIPSEGEKPEQPFRIPKGEELGAWGEAAPKAPAPAPKKSQPAPPKKEELFDYTFQIAAFKSLAEAENLQKKLAAISVKTKIQKSGKVQLLIANMRGPAKTPDNLRQKLLPLKLGTPLQLSKKPLPSGPKRNK